MKRYFAAIIILLLAAFGCAPLTPTTLPAFGTGISPDGWAKIPAGEFPFGQHDQPTLIPRDFEIMVTDVTNAQYARFLNSAIPAGKVKIDGSQVKGYYAGDVFRGLRHEEKITAGDWPIFDYGSSDARITLDGKTFQVRPGYENHPVTMVTWFGAKTYADYYGWRMPTESEWEKAARGVDGRAYPWGNEMKPGNANYYKSHDPFEFPGQVGDTTPAGLFNGKTYDGFKTLNSPSAYGAYDMAGNVWQWTADIIPGIHYRYLRGGSKADYAYDCRVWSRNSARPDYASASIGFRCVRDLK